MEWVYCKECIYVNDNCVEARRADGCYHGETEKYCEDKLNGLIHCESCHEKCDKIRGN